MNVKPVNSEKREAKTKEKKKKMNELQHFIAANGAFTQTTGKSGKLLQMMMEL